MTRPPRVHHFVPQFWIKNFVADDGKQWAYDWDDDRIKERSSKQLMQVFNLYTIEPSGLDDTTLETRDNNKIDHDGSQAFDRVLKGDHGEDAKLELAQFFAAQVMRHPDVILTYNGRAQELTLSLLEVFEAPDYNTFHTRWAALYPGAHATEDEYNHIKFLGPKEAEAALEKIIIALDTTQGLPELPFTDAVRSPDGRSIVFDRLVACDWMLKTTTNDRFILGDAGVLYEKSDMETLRAPLSKTAALFLTPANSPQSGIGAIPAAEHEVMNLNMESAARSRRWLVGEPALLQAIKTQVHR